MNATIDVSDDAIEETRPISNVGLFESALALEDIPGANRLYLKIIEQAIDANRRAREIEDQRRRLAREVRDWTQRATRAERQARGFAAIGAVLSVTLVLMMVILAVVMAA